MPVTRRTLLGASAAGLGAAALGGPLTGPASAAPSKAVAGPLPDAFRKLPAGSVTPRGWLAGQLRLQLDGLCGRYEEISHFLDFDTTGWVHPERPGWEELPYWLRGYVPLAVATGDTAALTNARRWIDAILATQQPDGFFGPRALSTSLGGGPDFWPFLPLLQALRTHEEFTGDERVVPFLLRFLRFMNAQGPGAFGTSWISYRWGDGLDIAVWLYRRTGETFLLDLAAKMHTLGADWTGPTPSRHNVNIAQGFREPAQYAQVTGSADLTRATYRAYDTVMAEYGRFPGGGMAGRRELPPRLHRPPPGLRDLRRRRVHGLPRTPHPHHRRRNLGGPLRGPGLQHAPPPPSTHAAGPSTTSPAPTASTWTTAPRHRASSRTASPCRPTTRAWTSTAAAPTTTAWAGPASPRNCGSAATTEVWPPRCTRPARSAPRSPAAPR